MNAPFIDGQTVIDNLTMPACIDLMAATQAAISRGEIRLPLRAMLPVGEGSAVFIVMPGKIGKTRIFGAKLVSLFPDNPARGMPAVQGHVALFDGENGSPLALVEAASITAVRTAAASGAATRLLARHNASTLALLGCGVQAETHLEAMLAVRPVREVRVWGRSLEKAEAFAARHAGMGGARVAAVGGARQAVAGADLICTVTGSRTPILKGEWVDSGAHLNLVGAHNPATREVDGAAMSRGRVFTEITEFALAEAGDLLLAIEEGHLAEADIAGEIGEAIDGKIPGRSREDDITIYKNQGNTAQDLAAAHYVYTRVRADAYA